MALNGSSERAGEFRRDIQGLRGVAVVLVVLFHVGVPGFSGGYVGVDAFFVISGFLITKQLLGDLDHSGRVALIQFWSRRLRRLMPLLLLTLTATLGAGLLVYSPLEWARVSSQARQAVVFMSNFGFASSGARYFQSAESPLLHTWSLGVEEQFYLGWPLLVAAAVFIARGPGRSRSRLLVAGISAATLVSFAAGIALTARGTAWAFFSPVTRAWQFGLGALAFTSLRRRGLNFAASTVLSCVAFALLIWAAMTFDELTPLPGSAALIPTIATAALLTTGGHQTRLSVNSALAHKPLVAIGGLSYAWYLFHWPAMVLASAQWFSDSVVLRLAAATLSLAAAHLATRYVERPIRAAPHLRRPPLVAALAAAGVLVLGAVTFMVDEWAGERLKDPFLATLQATRSARLAPEPTACAAREIVDEVELCFYGNPTSSTLVVLVGDSHARQWTTALAHQAERRQVKFVSLTYGGCPAVDVLVRRIGFSNASTGCRNFRNEIRRLLPILRPDLVVLGGADLRQRLLDASTGQLLSPREADIVYGTSAEEFSRFIDALGADLALIADNPSLDKDPIECLARKRSAKGCAAAVSEALEPVTRFNSIIAASVRVVVGPIPTLNINNVICDEVKCQVLLGNVVVFADVDHLSTSFTHLVEQEVDEWFDESLSSL